MTGTLAFAAKEIQKMEAGRELDALVHLHLFGKDVGCIHYSSDIHAAWQAMEEVHKYPRLSVDFLSFFHKFAPPLTGCTAALAALWISRAAVYAAQETP